jgi:hypothetical protein
MDGATGELSRQCSLCRAAIPDEFYALRGLTLCPRCADGLRKRREGQGSARRALWYGLLATVVCAGIWLLVARATKHALPWLAIPTGITIGLSLHQGSGGIGGRRNQIAAALMVYVAAVVPYVPPVFGGISDSIKKQNAPRTAKPATSEVQKGPTGQPSQVATPTGDTAAAAVPQGSTFATFKAYFVFTVVAWGLVLATPFLTGSAGVLAPISLVLGMALAWRLNRRTRLSGPHQPTP